MKTIYNSKYIIDLIKNYTIQHCKNNQCIIGIVGPPGSGKSTVALKIAKYFKSDFIPLDGYHYSNKVLHQLRLSHLKGAIETFDSYNYVKLIYDIYHGYTPDEMYIPEFDRNLGEPINCRLKITNTKIVVTEGNYLLVDQYPWNLLRNLIDFFIYIEIPYKEMYIRLLKRHMKYGMNYKKAVKQVKTVDTPNMELIESTKEYADKIL